MPRQLGVLGVWIAKVLGIGLLGIAIVMGVRWLSRPNPDYEELRESSLEVEWNNTISKLGIEPTYPPEEDLAVGDIFAVVLKDDEPDTQFANSLVKPRSPYLKRSVKLAHVDVRKELDAAYSMLPTFSDLESMRAVLPQAPDSGRTAAAHDVAGLFMHDMPRKELPRAAFPSLKIQSVNRADGGLFGGALGFLNFGASSQSLEELQLLDVMTYGLPSVRAYEALWNYCNDNKTKSDCLDQTARKHLEPIVGSRIWFEYLDPKDKTMQHAVTIGIVMVNRVYLTRSILHVRRSGSAQSGGARVEVVLPDGKNEIAVKGSQTTAPSASRDAAADANDNNTGKKRLDEVERQLAKLQQGGAIAYAEASGNEILLKETFTRPVAIGYRSVAYDAKSATNTQ